MAGPTNSTGNNAKDAKWFDPLPNQIEGDSQTYVDALEKALENDTLCPGSGDPDTDNGSDSSYVRSIAPHEETLDVEPIHYVNPEGFTDEEIAKALERQFWGSMRQKLKDLESRGVPDCDLIGRAQLETINGILEKNKRILLGLGPNHIITDFGGLSSVLKIRNESLIQAYGCCGALHKLVSENVIDLSPQGVKYVVDGYIKNLLYATEHGTSRRFRENISYGHILEALVIIIAVKNIRGRVLGIPGNKAFIGGYVDIYRIIYQLYSPFNLMDEPY